MFFTPGHFVTILFIRPTMQLKESKKSRIKGGGEVRREIIIFSIIYMELHHKKVDLVVINPQHRKRRCGLVYLNGGVGVLLKIDGEGDRGSVIVPISSSTY